ncbi:hypothetical protein PC115_g16921 [Phytophthora cactorum]|uniref:Uncharacterized protein n=1 Tax=Phytophthora cactorum TaxID=29920 RepID=A0A8T1BB17_9STRA|nr:hypothetical protein PC115_g16921 [Phytophthora cactorum]KAG3045084.1 hypothetical protein PC122_g24690 [Phytophthora cactorum]KAG3122090.1 hypothetical protein C6341_g27119 [Phytophthora cactorum]KAG4036849.1 hypothetical protein PC123_g27583 [Phytophthora cactorum]
MTTGKSKKVNEVVEMMGGLAREKDGDRAASYVATMRLAMAAKARAASELAPVVAVDVEFVARATEPAVVAALDEPAASSESELVIATTVALVAGPE